MVTLSLFISVHEIVSLRQLFDRLAKQLKSDLQNTFEPSNFEPHLRMETMKTAACSTQPHQTALRAFQHPNRESKVTPCWASSVAITDQLLVA
jgi:hypothetical protein